MQVVGERVALAQTAAARKDWGRALEHWRLVADQAPLLSVGWTGIGQALIELGRLDEAEVVLGPIADRFREDRSATILYASIAAVRRDWAEMLRRSQVVARRFADDPTGYINVGIALRELGRLDESDAALATAIARFPDNRWALIHRAANAMRRRDWQEALARWQAIVERYPEELEPHLEMGAALCEFGRWEEADAVLSKAMDRFPENIYLAANFARIAMSRRDWNDAFRRWHGIRNRFPNHPLSLIGLGDAFLEAGRYDEAETAYSGAAQLSDAFPEFEWSFAGFAEVAARRGDWTEALRRWEIVKTRFPNFAHAWLRCADALKKLSKPDAADAMLGAALHRCRTSREVATAYAQHAGDRGHWEEALRRWGDAKERFPDQVQGYIGIATVLSRLGRCEAADAAFARAADRFPGNPIVISAHAKSAARHQDWEKAVRCWDLLLRHLPSQDEARLGKADALAAACGIEPAIASLHEPSEQQDVKWWYEARQWFADNPTFSSGIDVETGELAEDILHHPDSCARLGDVTASLDQRQQVKTQIALFEYLLARDPLRHFWVRYRAAICYEFLGNAEAACLVARGTLNLGRDGPHSFLPYRIVLAYLRARHRWREAIELCREQIGYRPEKPIAERWQLRELAGDAEITLDEDLAPRASVNSAAYCRAVRVLEAEPRPGWSCRAFGSGLPPELAALGREQIRPAIDVVLWPNAELLICNGTTVVVDAAGRVIPELSVAEYPELVRQKVHRILAAGGGEEHASDTVIQLSDRDAAPNLCHFLADHITRLDLYDRAGALAPDALCVGGPIAADFQRAVLAKLGITRWLDVERIARIKARELWVSTNCRDVMHPAHLGARWAIEFLRRRFGVRPTADRDRLYISRSDVGTRTIHNEDELVRELERRGFAKVVMGRMPFAEQVATLAGASHIVAMHGAGLTNAIFAPAEVAVLEIFHPMYATTSYAALAQSADWRYAALGGRDWELDTTEMSRPESRASARLNFIQRNVLVDLEPLRSWLDEFAG